MEIEKHAERFSPQNKIKTKINNKKAIQSENELGFILILLTYFTDISVNKSLNFLDEQNKQEIDNEF